MLVTFTTKAYADITMFGDVGLSMLKMMGLSGTVPGALLAEDIPEALDKLQRAIDAQDVTPQTNDDDDVQFVSIHNRALPLLELLAAAAKEGADVMWK